MKASKQLQATIADAIAPYDNQSTRTQYRAGNFHRADKVQDLNKRYRWDLFWHIQRNHYDLEIYQQCSDEDLNDSHIDTMLRSIVAPL